MLKLFFHIALTSNETQHNDGDFSTLVVLEFIQKDKAEQHEAGSQEAEEAYHHARFCGSSTPRRAQSCGERKQVQQESYCDQQKCQSHPQTRIFEFSHFRKEISPLDLGDKQTVVL